MMNMKTTRMLILAMAVAAGGNYAFAQQGGPPKLVTEVCSNCHGYKGRSVSPIFPNLAGQHAAYLESELKKFRDRSRGDPRALAYMWGTAHELTDAKIKELTAYFAAQAPTPGTPQDPAAVAAGQKIYANGIASTGVPPCFACHGEKALGGAVQGAETTPRLAGQHREYLTVQLLVFKTGLRASDIMHNNAKNMTDEQIKQVAAYLASL